ncbi:MAG: hypothetical protein BJ554DRAFT_4043 [Olpidium bornovanus]|uniref:Uncharacterized protein n=1 Tax=Olpidium bornovanus TaxID=278681 RepID=A0A8H8DFT3_9FUNG|nr:MAG: hypothetical protein BJ554DRAFT_4043 [Olpidium bornovanus]
MTSRDLRSLHPSQQNQQILRDYSLLQMQMRQYEGLAVRRRCLILFAYLLRSWLSLTARAAFYSTGHSPRATQVQVEFPYLLDGICDLFAPSEGVRGRGERSESFGKRHEGVRIRGRPCGRGEDDWYSILRLPRFVMGRQRWNESVSQLSYEYSEMLLYKNMIIEESGDTERALSHLDEIEFKVCDKIALKERRGKSRRWL